MRSRQRNVSRPTCRCFAPARAMRCKLVRRMDPRDEQVKCFRRQRQRRKARLATGRRGIGSATIRIERKQYAEYAWHFLLQTVRERPKAPLAPLALELVTVANAILSSLARREQPASGNAVGRSPRVVRRPHHSRQFAHNGRVASAQRSQSGMPGKLVDHLSLLRKSHVHCLLLKTRVWLNVTGTTSLTSTLLASTVNPRRVLSMLNSESSTSYSPPDS